MSVTKRLIKEECVLNYEEKKKVILRAIEDAVDHIKQEGSRPAGVEIEEKELSEYQLAFLDGYEKGIEDGKEEAMDSMDGCSFCAIPEGVFHSKDAVIIDWSDGDKTCCCFCSGEITNEEDLEHAIMRALLKKYFNKERGITLDEIIKPVVDGVFLDL